MKSTNKLHWIFTGLFGTRIATGGLMMQMTCMILPFGLGISSNIFYHKRMNVTI
jgi:hypothetical protein